MLVAQSCPTRYNPMVCSLPISSVHGILQARKLEWVPFLIQWIFQTQGWNRVSFIAGWFITSWANANAFNRILGNWSQHCIKRINLSLPARLTLRFIQQLKINHWALCVCVCACACSVVSNSVTPKYWSQPFSLSMRFSSY